MNAPLTSSLKPLAGVRVVLTRAAEDNEELQRALEGFGGQVLSLPTVRRLPPLDWVPADRVLLSLESFAWIVFTSRWTVHSMFQRMREIGLPQALPDRLAVAAVGPSTVRVLEERGVRVDCVGREAKGESLAEAMIQRGVSGRPVLLPGSDIARPELPQLLRRAGATVEQVVVYRTVLPEEESSSLAALREGTVDVVVLASPSAVRNLVNMLGGQVDVLAETRLVSIGPTTSAALRKNNLFPVAEAEPHTAAGLVSAIVGLHRGETPNDERS